jgi:hypothetical protein
MKAKDYVADITLRLGGVYNHEKDCDIVIELLFDLILEDASRILETRCGSKPHSLDHLFDSYTHFHEKHLGSVFQEINLKAMKINKVGNYGFTENWFQIMFAVKVREFIDKNPESSRSWQLYMADCKEMSGVNYPAFAAIKEFLNP